MRLRSIPYISDILHGTAVLFGFFFLISEVLIEHISLLNARIPLDTIKIPGGTRQDKIMELTF